VAEIDWRAFSRVIDVFSSEEYAPVLRFFYLWIVDKLDERDLEPEEFLEIGCGTGFMAEQLVEWYPDARFCLVDSSPEMLQVARERFSGAENVAIIERAAEDFLATCEPESVATAVFCRSFYALRDPEQAAAATLRALRAGGLAFVFDFTSPQDLEAMDRFFNDAEPERWPIARVAYQEFNEGVASGRYSLFSEDQMRAIWAEAGAEVIDYDLHEPERLTHRFCILKP
jgi:ubiquinone/menaquinone biosynthesis C-methylase UbiE